MKKLFLFPLLLLLGFVPGTQAYGPDGHKIIGAIADQKLANTPTGARVPQLLDGLHPGRSGAHGGHDQAMGQAGD